MEDKTFSLYLQDRELKISLNNWAEQANGNLVVRTGDTTVLLTAVMSRTKNAGLGFFPLTVDYEERFYAAGKILGSRFMRREGRPSDEAIITARVIDRAIRPLFPKRFFRETQVIATCLSWDSHNDSDVIALFGASLALGLSDIPWKGPLGAVRVGRIDGKFIYNPTYEERAESELDFVIAGVKEGKEVMFNMIESESSEISESTFEEALAFAKPLIEKQIEFQEEIISKHGKEKLPHEENAKDESSCRTASFS